MKIINKNTQIKLKAMLLTAITSLAFSPSVYASNKIMESSLFKTGITFLNDITTVLLVIVPIIAAILLIIFAIRKGHSVEQHDIEKYKKAMSRTIVSAIIAFSASGIITLLTSYFGGSVAA